MIILDNLGYFRQGLERPLNVAFDVMILVCYACPKSGPLHCQLYITALPEAPLNYFEPKQK